MSKKNKKKNIAADELIDSLMEDLKNDSSSESSVIEEADNLFGSEEGTGLRPSQVNIGLMPEESVAKEQDSITAWRGIDTSSSAEENPFSEVSEEGFQKEEGYQGPSVSSGFNSVEEIMNQMNMEMPKPPAKSASRHLASSHASSEDDQTRPLIADPIPSDSLASDPDRTQAVEGFANVGIGRRSHVDEKVSIGALRGSKVSHVLTSVDASLAQAENLKLAQSRMLQLEDELEKLRQENEELASAADIIKTRTEEYASKINALEKEKHEQAEAFQSEIIILKGSLQYKETEVAKSRIKIEDLETRLKNDFKKIRVRERELENRLELARAEKAALIRSKDEYILDLKRKVDRLQSELDNYRSKVIELNKTIESNQEQFKRTVRALRLALSNLESKDENIVPLKKAE